MNSTCAKEGCKEKLHGMNSKHCKLCEQQVCIDHLQPENHDCPKVVYTKYIRNTGWLIKRGVNVTTSPYSVICETCGYVSDLPQLIEYSGKELVLHLNNNPECKEKKKTFLEEFYIDPIPKGKIESSIVRDPDRKLWVCSHCRPPRKFTNHDEYIAHHYTHS